MKINILFKFQKGPWGGGNQFLKVLKNYFIEKNVYTQDPFKADVIIINSHQFTSKYIFDTIHKIKKKPNKIVIHRVAGPILFHRNDKFTDSIIFQYNNLIADGTIFQSKWSQDKNYELKMKKSPYEEIIPNAPNPSLFHHNENVKRSLKSQKIKLIATSWSPNPKKGFEIYKFLDENLNYSQYEMTFVGNSPITFKNIKWIKPVPSSELATILRKHDIFITASEKEACSNSLIEALSCGLPAVVLNDASNPEVVKKGGECFNGKEDVIEKIEKIAKNYDYYTPKIPNYSIKEIGNDYYTFIDKIYQDVEKGKYNPKKVDLSDSISYYKIKMRIKFKSFIQLVKNLK